MTQQGTAIMEFSITNPHDPYTITSPSFKLAALAVCLIGEGAYGMQGIGGAAGLDMPIFLTTGEDQWFIKEFGADFNSVLTDSVENSPLELAATLESVRLVRMERSSTVDLIDRAGEMAMSLRYRAPRPAAVQAPGATA